MSYHLFSDLHLGHATLSVFNVMDEEPGQFALESPPTVVHRPVPVRGDPCTAMSPFAFSAPPPPPSPAKEMESAGARRRLQGAAEPNYEEEEDSECDDVEDGSPAPSETTFSSSETTTTTHAYYVDRESNRLFRASSLEGRTSTSKGRSLPRGTELLSRPEHVSAMLSLSTIDFNRWVKQAGFTDEEIAALKTDRRRIKNSAAAEKRRRQKTVNNATIGEQVKVLTARVAELEAQLAASQESLRHAREELLQYRAGCR